MLMDCFGAYLPLLNGKVLVEAGEELCILASVKDGPRVLGMLLCERREEGSWCLGIYTLYPLHDVGDYTSYAC